MTALETEVKITLKNILFATDFEAQSGRALRFALALSGRYDAKLYVVHVVPRVAYAYVHPESMERVLKEAYAYAKYEVDQIIMPLEHQGRSCEPLLADGNPGEVITALAREHAADLIVVGTSSRAGLRKLFLGSVAEEIIREAPCPVLTIGPRVASAPFAGIQSIICSVDFSPASVRAVEFSRSLAHEYQAHLTLVHVVEGILKNSPRLAARLTEERLWELLPPEPELQHEPGVLVETGPVPESILRIANELSADLIAMGARGAGAFAQTVSHFGSVAHKVISLAACPVLTHTGAAGLEKT